MVPLYRVGFNNFYAITRYNRSPMYAMAVHDLGEAIQNLHEGYREMRTPGAGRSSTSNGFSRQWPGSSPAVRRLP